MKKNKNGNKKMLLVYILFFAMLSGMIPTAEVSAASTPTATKSLTIIEGKKKKIAVKGAFIGSKSFKSSKPGIATVSENGVVKAQKEGKCKITVTVMYCKTKHADKVFTKKLSCKVTVKQDKSKNKQDVTALKALIKDLRKRGATVSDALSSRKYGWKNGRLVYIFWDKCNISGKLDISGLKALTSLDCSDNQLSSLKLNNNINFEGLDCSNNNLTSLDVKKYVKLKTLACSDNKLKNLDVSKNVKLGLLVCNNTQLSSLDVSRNVKLKYLDCNNNQLSSLNLNKNVALEQFECSGNKLSSLDLSSNTKLIILDCNNNQLTDLNVSKNVVLRDLNCDHNLLSSLDLSKNVKLQHLYCKYNNLSSLDVSKNVKLMNLQCFGNPLTSLNLTNNTKLGILACDDTVTIEGYDGYINHEDTTAS